MKKSLLVATAAVLTLAIAPVAFAADGTITFNGAISDSTCDITGGAGTNGGKNDFTVTLPTVQVSALNADGQRAGDTYFEVKLDGANCINSKTAKLWWETAHSPNIDVATGRLKNTASSGAAGKVQVGLKNSSGADIHMFQNTNPSTVVVANNVGTLAYTAQYVATGGAATAGAVATSVVYSVAYN